MMVDSHRRYPTCPAAFFCRPSQSASARCMLCIGAPMSIENPYVAKYGKFLHLERALQGAWRVTPATEYKRTDLTAAQQDDELKKSSLMSPTTTIGVPVPTGGFVRVAPIGRV